jgi:arsenical-resistance protein 2
MDTAQKNLESQASLKTESPWYASYPEPQRKAGSVSREELLQWLRDGKQSGNDFLLVDLRRTDFEVRLAILILCSLVLTRCQGGTIQGSLNLPAQSLYPTIPILYSVVSRASVKAIVWYCGTYEFIPCHSLSNEEDTDQIMLFTRLI